MAFCETCGKEVKEDEKFCENCGESIGNAKGSKAENTSATEEKTVFEETFKKFNNTKDTTSEYNSKDIEDGKLMAILSYFSILVLIPMLSSKSKFVRFHINQGLILLICEVIAAIVSWMLPWRLDFIANILYLFVAVLAVIGIINVVNGRAKEIPLVGHIKLIK